MSAVGTAPGRSRWQRALRRVFPVRIDHPPAEQLPAPAWLAAAAEFSDGRATPGDAASRAGRVLAFGRWIDPVTGADGAPDWHVDPIDGVRWPANARTRGIPIRGPDRPGDVKHVWEPSRFLHLFDLVHDGPEGEAQAVRDVASWIGGARLGRGVHWDNGLEAAIRAISWVHADGVLAPRGTSAWRALRPRLLASLATHARFIEQNLEPGAWNHLVGDAAGLAVIGASYPDLDGACGWLARGLDILERETSRQLLDDGGHAERAPAYARAVADLCLVSALAVREHDARRADLLLGTARRLLVNLVAQSTPAGDLPGYGDDDGATVLWTCKPCDRLAVSAAIVGACSGWSEGIAFASGTAGWVRAREVAARLLDDDTRVLVEDQTGRVSAVPLRPRDLPSVVLRETGVAVGRSAGAWALVRCGPSGVGSGAHAHMDQLAVLWQSPAGWSLVDPGTPTYNADDAVREAATATRSHSTVSIDGASQSERVGRFAWRDLPAGRLVGVSERRGLWTARGSVDYDVRGVAVSHRRQVGLGADSLEIADDVRAEGAHDAELTLLLRSDGASVPVWDAVRRRVIARGLPSLELAVTGWESVDAAPATASPVYGAIENVLALRLHARLTGKLYANVTLRVCGETAR